MLAGTSDPHMLPGRGLDTPNRVRWGPRPPQSQLRPCWRSPGRAMPGGGGCPSPRSCLDPASRGPPVPQPPAGCCLLWPEPGETFLTLASPSPSPAPDRDLFPAGSRRSEQGGLREALMGHNGWGGRPPGACPARTPSSIRSCGPVSANEAPPLPLGLHASHRPHACCGIFQSWAS